MRLENEAALRELIAARKRELESRIMALPDDASEVSEEMLTSMMELADLESELELLRGNRPDSGDPDAPVGVPLKPLPSHNSGAVALPKPDLE
jgi:hypothetical protein